MSTIFWEAGRRTRRQRDHRGSPAGTADGTREDLITELARIFDVSAKAMGYRLINLGILTA
jgi:hypothetical protein